MSILKMMMPGSVKKLLRIIFYVLMIGPPQTLAIKRHAKKHQGELCGCPLYIILAAESALRAGTFLLIAFSVEQFLGDAVYEKYRLDYFFFWLIFAGAIHISGFYLSKLFLVLRNRPLALFLCRLGRNSAYAVVPAFIAVMFALVYQYRNQIELFSGILVQSIFFSTFLVFIFIGVQEAIIDGLNPSKNKKKIAK